MDYVDIKGTIIALRDTDYPGADAEVFIDNHPMNNETDNGTHTLELGEMRVDVTFLWHPGGDEVIVTPPDGYVCLPSCTQIVEEGLNLVIYLLPFLGA